MIRWSCLSDGVRRSEEHTSELQSPCNLVCRLPLEKKKKKTKATFNPAPPSLAHRQNCLPHMLSFPTGVLINPSLAFFFFNDTATTEIYTLSLHDALPIYFVPELFPHPVNEILLRGEGCGHGRKRFADVRRRAGNHAGAAIA